MLKRGRYFDNAEDARRACGQMIPVAPLSPTPSKQPTVKEGACCLDGALHSISRAECRERGGRFYDDRREADRDCRGERPPEGVEGVCCLNGELQPLPAPECEERHGRFFERIEEAERLCRKEGPPPPEVICCLDGRPQTMPEPECRCGPGVIGFGSVGDGPAPSPLVASAARRTRSDACFTHLH
jgi:hypothetical protein